jgi:hypothetical protein
MKRSIEYFAFVMGLGLAITSALAQVPGTPKIRLFLSEVQPGSLAADHYCTLVFTDRHFHSEKANRRNGKDVDRKIYEGELPESEWNALGGILDSKNFREIKLPASIPPLVVQDSHPYNISVARDGSYQNLEFLDGKSMKPYESQIKPLLQWWKALRGHRVPESKAPPDQSCSLDSTHAIISQ